MAKLIVLDSNLFAVRDVLRERQRSDQVSEAAYRIALQTAQRLLDAGGSRGLACSVGYRAMRGAA